MADRSLINLWLLNASDAVGTTAAAQITWLREQRKTYATSVTSGDWATEQTSGDGSSASSKRGVTDKDNHDAIVSALRSLGADLGEVGSRPGVLIPTFGEILN